MLGLLQLTQSMLEKGMCQRMRRVKCIHLFSHAVGKYIKSRLFDSRISIRHFRRWDTIDKRWSSQK